MTDHLAFLAAIRADPTSDTPRLIYADWLEEQGDGDRAEFVRLQMELAHGRRQPSEVEARFATLRFGWLLDGLPPGYRWFSLKDGCFFISGLEAYGFALVFRRGLLEEVTLRCAEWYRRGPVLVREHLLKRARLVDWLPRAEGRDQYNWAGPPYRWLQNECRTPELAQKLYQRSATHLNLSFETERAAFDAMSQVCLDWARNCEPDRKVQDQTSLPPYLAARYDT